MRPGRTATLPPTVEPPPTGSSHPPLGCSAPPHILPPSGKHTQVRVTPSHGFPPVAWPLLPLDLATPSPLTCPAPASAPCCTPTHQAQPCLSSWRCSARLHRTCSLTSFKCHLPSEAALTYLKLPPPPPPWRPTWPVSQTLHHFFPRHFALSNLLCAPLILSCSPPVSPPPGAPEGTVSLTCAALWRTVGVQHVFVK